MKTYDLANTGRFAKECKSMQDKAAMAGIMSACCNAVKETVAVALCCWKK
jgi:hypothetical protein